MGSALTIGLVSGGLSALTSLGSGLAQSNQQRNQARAMEAQAAQTRAQANMEAQRGAIEAENIARQKRKLTREYNDIQARNRVNAGAGFVDMTSGSMLMQQLGNADRYAADVAENEYDRVLKINEANNAVKALNWQADQYDANSSYMKRSADNMAGTALGAIANGFVSGLGTYIGAGGKLFGNSSIAKTYHDAVKDTEIWDIATKTRIR